jgi:hypothetical protein
MTTPKIEALLSVVEGFEPSILCHFEGLSHVLGGDLHFVLTPREAELLTEKLSDALEDKK